MFNVLLVVFFSLVLSTAASAFPTKVIQWDVAMITAAPDGVSRSVIGINGNWPPVPVWVDRHDHIVLQVKNHLAVPITVHTHGIDEVGTTYWDGVDRVTQCGIPPGDTLEYHPNLGDQVGTYWFHTHILGQYPDGLRTAFIIVDPESPFTYDYETSLTVSDWYDQPITNKGVVEQPNATLILDVEKPVLSVVPGTTVRFHIVNLSARALFHVWFEGHLMSVIEVDGVDVVPYGVEGITIAIGQRYSVLVSMLANPTRNYPIVAAMDTTDEGIFPGGNPNATAWLQYDIAAPRPPAQNIPRFYPFDDTALNPYVYKPVVPADRNITIVVAFANGEAMMNGVSYVAPQVPTLFTAMNASNPLDPSIYGNTTNSFVLNYGDMIYLIVQNDFFSVAHPFHLHGHTFQVLYRSPPNSVYNPNQTYQFPENPVRRDVILVNPKGFVIIAFRADNPGVWFFHCHIEFHVLIGMIAQFVEAPDVMQETLTIPQVLYDQCAEQGVETHQDRQAVSGKEDGNSGTALHFQQSWWGGILNFIRSILRL